MGSLVRIAPEHVRPVSAIEAQLIPKVIPDIQNQHTSTSTTDTTPITIPNEPSQIRQTPAPNTITQPLPINTEAAQEQSPVVPQQTTSPNSQDSHQPDQEPEANIPENTQPAISPEISTEPTSQPWEIPVPNEVDDELVCDLLLCEDDDGPSPWETSESLAWRFEVDVPTYFMTEAESNVEDAILLATNQKKQRTEVKLSQLTSTERELFEKSKTTEINNWIQTGTVCKVLRDSLSPEQILRCRWIHVWKPIEDPVEQAKAGRDRKAKSRLVVLGYLDPDLENIPRDSPTLGRQSRMLILQLIASMSWNLMSFDVKAAFLQGRTQEGRKIGLEPVPELSRAMNLKTNEVCQLSKSAYGLIDAPFLWYKAFDSTLKSLGFTPSPFDPCVYVLYRKGNSRPSGVIGIHVDDGLSGGDEYFQEQLSKLEKIYPFGSKKTQSFVFTGIEMNQLTNKSIELSQEKYITKIEPIHIKPERKSNLEDKVTEDEKLSLRAIIGSLQYAAVNTRPDLASRLSYLQSNINSATIQTLIDANRVLHEAKKHKDTRVTVQSIDIQQLRFLAFSDASFSSRKQPDSHTGMMIMATHANIEKNHQCPVSPLSWGCKKIQKVVVSTLAAETTSLHSTLDQLSWIRLFWAWILDPTIKWNNPKSTLENLPTTYAAPTIKSTIDSIAVTDCKSLFDLITRTAAPNCQEWRTQLQARAIKDLISEGVAVRWVHSGAQLADALTKVMESSFLRHTLKQGTYRLHDEDQILKQRADARTRIKWLKDEEKENS